MPPKREKQKRDSEGTTGNSPKRRSKRNVPKNGPDSPIQSSAIVAGPSNSPMQVTPANSPTVLGPENSSSLAKSSTPKKGLAAHRKRGKVSKKSTGQSSLSGSSPPQESSTKSPLPHSSKSVRPITAPLSFPSPPRGATCCNYDAALAYFATYVNESDFLHPVREIKIRYQQKSTFLQEKNKSDRKWASEAQEAMTGVNTEITDAVIGMFLSKAKKIVENLSKQCEGKRGGGQNPKSRRSYAVDLESVIQQFLQEVEELMDVVNRDEDEM